MRNVRPRPALRRCFPLCGGSDDRDRDFGPDTFRGEERRGERASGTHNAEAFFVGRDQLWSGLGSGAKQGVKRSSIRWREEGPNAEGAERMGQRKNERTNACLPLALACRSSLVRSVCLSVCLSVVVAVMARSIGSKDEIKSSPRLRAERARGS